MTEVLKQTGLSRSTVFRYLDPVKGDPTFPKRRYINGNKRVVVFLESEIQEWMAEQINNTTYEVQ